MTCARCSQEKYTAHSVNPPHPSLPFLGECEGYVPTHPCNVCGVDVERHDPTPPHPCTLGGVLVCAGVESNWRDPTYEGGGGSSGGGGASGSW